MRLTSRQSYGSRGFMTQTLSLGLSTVVAVLVSTNVIAQPSWRDEIDTHFPPSVPSSTSGPVDYTYEFFAYSDGYNDDCVTMGTSVSGFTTAIGTISGVTTVDVGVAEQVSHGVYPICQGIQSGGSCYQSYNGLPSPAYTPSQDAGNGGGGTCQYTSGVFYNGIIDFLRSIKPGPPDVTTQVTTSPGFPTTPGWRIEYTYASSPPLWYYYESRTCPCDGTPPYTAYPIIEGWSAYYKVVVHLDQGIAAPALPPVPGPAVGGSRPTVTITVPDNTAWENPTYPTDLGKFRISRTGSTSSSLVVYFTTGGTATGPSPSMDYTLNAGGNWVSTSATIPAGSSYVDVDVYPWWDGHSEDPYETVILTLSTNSSYTTGSPNSGTVYIYD